MSLESSFNAATRAAVSEVPDGSPLAVRLVVLGTHGLDVVDSFAPQLWAAIDQHMPPLADLADDATMLAGLEWLERFDRELASVAGAVRLALRKTQHALVPAPVTAALTSIRAGAVQKAPEIARGSDMLGDGAVRAELATASDVAIAIPFAIDEIDVIDRVGANARRVLSGGVLRAYVACWALWGLQGRDKGGLFSRDDRRVVSDLYGAPMLDDRGRERSSPARLAEFARDFETLTGLGVRGVQNWRVRTPEALIQVYTDETGTFEDCHRHAPIGNALIATAFTQIPLAVLRLDDARDVPLALGLAGFWRAHITGTLRTAGVYRSTLGELLGELGEDAAAHSRRDGTSYWRRIAERLARVAAAGGLGSVHVEGEGPAATVTIEPSPSLATVYAPLRDAADKQAARAAARASGRRGKRGHRK